MLRRLLFLPGLLAGHVGCSTTPYDFFDKDSPLCTGDACGGAGGGDGGSRTSPSFEPGVNCESRIYDGKTVERIALTASEGCLVADEYAPLNGTPAYYLYVGECAENAKAYFTLFETEGVLELRNESTRFNVDVVFAATSDGIPLFLYSPNDLENQRFEVRAATGDSFRLAPLNATTKCLSERNGRLELWPCADDDATQLFSRLACR